MSATLLSSRQAPTRDSTRTRQRLSEERSAAAFLNGACVCVPATLCVLLFIFAGTLGAAIVTWRHYTMLRDHDLWVVRGCTVHSTDVSADASPSIEALRKRTYFRAQANVSTSVLNDTAIAFWGRDASFTLSAEQAASRARSVTKGDKVSCWSRRRTPRQISMIAVSRMRAPAEDLYLNMAWGSSFFATISGALVLSIGANFVQRGLFGVATSVHTTVHGAHDPLKHPVCLTSAQAKYVMQRFGELDNVAVDTWTCSICLEDDERGTAIRKVTLPCKHRYHVRCLRKWLRRGAPTCPLCNWNVQTLFDHNGDPIEEDHNVATPSDATVIHLRADQRHGEEGAVTELEDIALPEPVSASDPNTVSPSRPP